MVEKIALFEANKDIQRWQKLAQEIILTCPKIRKDREREILADRFGIDGRAKTLQAIGDKYGITRERVRQIVNNSLQKIRKHCATAEVKNLLREIEGVVNENGGYASNRYLGTRFTDGSTGERNGLNFVVSLSSNLENVKTSNIFHEGWRKKSVKVSELRGISVDAAKLLKEDSVSLETSKISEKLDKPAGLVQAALSSNKNLMQDDMQKWGLARWPHINPKSIKDKSRYIMVRHGKPIHYSVLAEKISKMGAKVVTKQSVHNELIKNREFVLVGRGIYALAEWGYKPGIVEDVIVSVLAEAHKPLTKEEIVERVLERRIVKPSTIILNLQRPKFKKVGKSVYTLN